MRALTLMTEQVALLLETDARGWSRVSLLQPFQRELGREELETIAGSMLEFLRGDEGRAEAEEEIRGVEARRLVSFARVQDSLWAGRQGGGSRWFLRDRGGEVLLEFTLTPGRGRRWSWALEEERERVIAEP